jgi:hypothetical protein
LGSLRNPHCIAGEKSKSFADTIPSRILAIPEECMNLSLVYSSKKKFAEDYFESESILE